MSALSTPTVTGGFYMLGGTFMDLHSDPGFFTSKSRYELLPAISHPEDIFRLGKKVEFRRIDAIDLNNTYNLEDTNGLSFRETWQCPGKVALSRFSQSQGWGKVSLRTLVM